MAVSSTRSCKAGYRRPSTVFTPFSRFSPLNGLVMKQVPALKAVPVIMTTAEANRASVTKGLVGGADGYITKPFKGENLLKGVKTVLGLR